MHEKLIANVMLLLLLLLVNIIILSPKEERVRPGQAMSWCLYSNVEGEIGNTHAIKIHIYFEVQ